MQASQLLACHGKGTMQVDAVQKQSVDDAMGGEATGGCRKFIISF
jgi:hypothetical protein